MPFSSGGPFGVREIRSLYPNITENHLRYLEKWGWCGPRPRRRARYSFADLTTIKHVAAQLEHGTPLRVVLRELAAERQGQLVLDFHASSRRAAPESRHAPGPPPESAERRRRARRCPPRPGR